MKEERREKEDITSNFDRVKKLIEKATNKNLQSVIIPLELIQYAGETTKAVFLARLLYLSDKGSKSNGFIWKSYPEWKKEIGLSKAQVERIVEDFRDKKKILEAKKMMAGSRNGNASNTWHYRLNINNFINDFNKFLAGRTERNLLFQSEETDGSITESTYRNTSENSLIAEEIFPEKEAIQQSGNDSIAYDFDYDESQDDLSAPAPQEFSLPDNFEPSLANQIWAIKTFPRKYLKPITEDFIYNFKAKPQIEDSIEGWQGRWRKWLSSDRQFGVSAALIEAEHSKIEVDFLNVVYDFVSDCERFPIVPLGYIEQYLEGNFEWEFVAEALEELADRGYLKKYFGLYYDAKKYESYPPYAKIIDEKMYKYSFELNNTKEILAFLKERLVVKVEDVIETFPDFPRESVENLFRVSLNKRFTQINEYYFEKFDYIKWFHTNRDEYITAIKSALEAKGISLPEDESENEIEEEELEIEMYG